MKSVHVIISFFIGLGLAILISIPIIGLFFIDISGQTLDFKITPTMVLVLVLVQDGCLSLVVYLRVIRPKRISTAEMGMHLGRLGKVVLAGTVGGVVLLGLNFLAEKSLTGLGMEPDMLILPQVESLSSLIILAVAIVIVAPIAEEVFFRGYAFRVFLKQRSRPEAYLYSALFFSLVHLSLFNLLPIFLLGLVLAYLFERYNSLVPCILAHMINNLVALIVFFYL